MNATQALLLDLRKRHKLSQSEITRRTGISQPKLSRWEAGEIAKAADQALKLADLAASCDRQAKRDAKTAAVTSIPKVD